MSYLRLFIELRKEDSGEGCGQIRVELQDRPGRVDCKVRCGLTGLLPGQVYDMALVCEHVGEYKEYPVGQFGSNGRGQAGPMFRGSFSVEPGQIPVTEFKAVVVRYEGGRLVGFRSEPILIPWKYEEDNEEKIESAVEAEPKEVDEEPEAVEEQVLELEPEILPETENPEEPESLFETATLEEVANLSVIAKEEEPEEVSPEAEEANSAEATTPVFAPEAIYVLRDLRQVDLMCGDAGRRAFQRYRHLILTQQGPVNYLGIPCRFRPTQWEELAEEGYTLFYTPHGDEPGFGEFGYWMKRL